MVVVLARQAGNRFLDSLKGVQIRALVINQPSYDTVPWVNIRRSQFLIPCHKSISHVGVYGVISSTNSARSHPQWMRSEWLESLTANAVVATVLGSIPASSDIVESEVRKMNQC
jgi:hypothetical protein